MLSAVAADSQVNFSNSVVAQESGEGECDNTGRARTRFSPAEEFLLDLRNLTHSWHADRPGLTTSSVYTDNTIMFLDFSPSLHGHAYRGMAATGKWRQTGQVLEQVEYRVVGGVSCVEAINDFEGLLYEEGVRKLINS